MSTKLLGLMLGLLLIAPARAEDDADPLPLIDGKVADLEGAIPDTDILRLLQTKRILRPEFGFQDLFLTKNSSAVLDIQTLGDLYPLDHLQFVTTNIDIVKGGSKDPTGGYRINVGDKTGSTQVIVFEKVSGEVKNRTPLRVYRVSVTDKDIFNTLQELKALIGNTEGIELRVVGDHIVVDGQVLVPKDMRRVLSVLSEYAKKAPILNLIEMSPTTLKLLAEKMEEEIAGGKDRPRDIRVKVLNGRFVMEGAVDKRADREAALQICSAYTLDQYKINSAGPGGTFKEVDPKDPNGGGSLGQCINQVRIRQGQPKEPDPILSVRVDFVTLSKDYDKFFQFRWAPGVNADTSVQYSSDVGKLTGTFAATILNLLPKLDTAASNGAARVLRSATLLVRDSPQKPKAAIEEDIVIPGAILNGPNGTQTQAQGSKLNTKVEIQAASVPGSDKVEMDIVAFQTEALETGGGSNKQTVNTSLVVSNGESAALGGLISERRKVDNVRDPRAPAEVQFELFEFGSQHEFKDAKSQFIIFVTPTKIRSPSEGTDALKRKFRLRK